MSGLLDGKAVLISGIGRGIGRVAALEFAAAGTTEEPERQKTVNE